MQKRTSNHPPNFFFDLALSPFQIFTGNNIPIMNVFFFWHHNPENFMSLILSCLLDEINLGENEEKIY